MELESTVCAAAKVLELVKVREGQNIPFGLVLSMESPADPAQDRAPRLASAIGPQWADRQVFLFCNDVETGAGAPPLEIGESALEYFDKCQSADGVIRLTLSNRDTGTFGSSDQPEYLSAFATAWHSDYRGPKARRKNPPSIGGEAAPILSQTLGRWWKAGLQSSPTSPARNY